MNVLPAMPLPHAAILTTSFSETENNSLVEMRHLGVGKRDFAKQPLCAEV
jgi:hypothetical protein